MDVDRCADEIKTSKSHSLPYSFLLRSSWFSAFHCHPEELPAEPSGQSINTFFDLFRFRCSRPEKSAIFATTDSNRGIFKGNTVFRIAWVLSDLFVLVTENFTAVCRSVAQSTRLGLVLEITIMIIISVNLDDL